MTLTCPTPCDPDCRADCHEWHQVPWKRAHPAGSCVKPEKPVWHSNVAAGDLTFDELAQAIYEAYSGRLWGEQATSWAALMDYEQVAWRRAAQVAHRKIVKQDQQGEPRAQ